MAAVTRNVSAKMLKNVWNHQERKGGSSINYDYSLTGQNQKCLFTIIKTCVCSEFSLELYEWWNISFARKPHEGQQLQFNNIYINAVLPEGGTKKLSAQSQEDKCTWALLSQWVVVNRTIDEWREPRATHWEPTYQLNPSTRLITTFLYVAL